MKTKQLSMPIIKYSSAEMSIFLLAHIYARHGILTHGLLTFSAITAQPFPSFR
jgi:hypothetical protein